MGGILRRLHRDQRGAVATVFAILLAGGVLLGMLALVVDVGRLYAEREELQSGADSAVVALAEKCAQAKSVTDCSVADVATLAARYADANAKDGSANVLEICGDVPASPFILSCDSTVGNLTDCIPAEYTEDRPYLEVRTGTQTSDDEFLLSPSFAQMLLGNGDYAGSGVRACARAIWGPPVSGSGLAVTFSTCEFDEATTDGTVYAAPPPAVPSDSYEQTLYLHNTDKAKTCPAGPSGWDFPGGFGWLDETECQAFIEVDETVGGNVSVSPSKSCKDLLPGWRDNHTVLLVPIHDGILGKGGSKVEYHVAGLAAFVVTGYHLPGLSEKSNLTNKAPCKGDDKCIYGYFTNALMPPTGGAIGDPEDDFGATIITLIG